MAGMDYSKPADDISMRFSDRVADYVRYRPSYPGQLVQDLVDAGRLSPGHVVADIGSGTGLLARRFGTPASTGKLERTTARSRTAGKAAWKGRMRMPHFIAPSGPDLIPR